MVVTEAEMNHPSSVVVRSEKGRKCRALFSYAPSHEDELELTVGDEIHFLGEVEEGWWRGKLGGKIGVFPSNFVIIEDPAPSAVTQVKGLPTNPPSVSSDVAPELPPKPLKETARVLFPYSALQPDELELREGDLVIIHSKDCEDKGWWKGEVNNKIGVFPDNFVEVIPHNSTSSAFAKSLHPASNISPSSCTNKAPQLRSGVLKNESGSLSLANTLASDPFGMYAGVTGNIVENPNSLSDEQKLKQVEADILNVITPTESLSHITTSRARPTKSRRPPSALFLKDSENCDSNGGFPVPSTAVGGLSVHPEELGQNRLLSPVELQQQRPKTTIRNSSIKPPWMEELKRNQEKKEKGSFTTTSSNTLEKPAVPPVKPIIIAKSVNTSTDVPQSEGHSFTRAGNEPVSHKVGQKNAIAKIEPSSSSIIASVSPEIPPPKSLVNTSGAPTLANVPLIEKPPFAVPTVVDEKSAMLGTGTSMSLKGSPEAGLNSLNIEEFTKQKLLSTFPSNDTKQSVGLPNHLPVSLNEEAQLSNSEDTVQHELQTLRLRVASLETTVQNLQMELMQLKNSSADEHRCRCLKKKNSNEASLVHI
ncbi:SH3 domain-containing kinase-binding protein 1-like isoform X3 [Daphnia pulex]|nr:SH3 domain-containing kinase-binding protein 1-like isoform X3 [Daphnia pulex]